MNSTVIYGSLAIYRPKVWLIVLAAAIPVLVGLSRVAVGVHYPTDVLAGWLVGTFSLSFISWLQKIVRKRWVLYLILIGAAVPGFFYCDSADFYTAVGTAAGFFAGNLFEMRYVKFENTRKPLHMVLRLAIGTAIFLGLKKLLELPLPLQRVTCDARVKANRDLVAWQRGPIVFSWEGEGFRERVPYWRRLNAGGPSRVWIPADGSEPTAETVTGDWFRNTGCPLDANNRKVTSSCFLKER